ncbi:hypothetical protein T01_4450 [Trichinella spiralis]|uniref:Uncharacterized protein n=1 Tax=Trichinella spiralis TaxID=6334 RepID=A0A0V0YXG1_TRISP|nr:hypothetical protein T01_4450 [Trichinella spiralis]
MLRQKCHYAFVLIRSRNLADVQVSSNLLEPQLWLGYPDREKVQ